MAIIIPMAKMPNNCEECDLKGLCPDYWTKIREEYTRPSWCQLDDLDATTFCGVPMEEAVEIMQMYRRGELVHFKNYAIKTEPFDKDINVRSKDERKTEGIWNAGYKTGYDKGYKDAQLVKERTEVVKDLVKDEPQTERSE